MRDSEKLADIKQARRELLQPPKKYTVSLDNTVAPSPYSVIPSRVFVDTRIQNATIRVLGTLCCHANKNSGIVFTNQLTIGNRLGISKQAVSRQMRLLEKCGYIKKIYKENPLRKKGRKGATWRVIYDPATSDEDIIAHTKPDFVAEQDIKETLEEVSKVNPQVDYVDRKVNLQVDCEDKKVNSQVDHNYSSISSNKDFREIAMQICKVYSREREERLGAMLGWRNDERQVAIVEKFLGQGHDKNVLLETFLGSLNHFKETGKRPPFSLAYYDKFFNKEEKESVKDIIKRTINRSRFDTVRKPR